MTRRMWLLSSVVALAMILVFAAVSALDPM
jgi:hypothetical protein